MARFVQLFIDAADVPAVRAFWVAALGYFPDTRDGVSDIFDPRRLHPVLVFQELDVSETERRRQQGRTGGAPRSTVVTLFDHRPGSSNCFGNGS